jgi:hypothetical protein
LTINSSEPQFGQCIEVPMKCNSPLWTTHQQNRRYAYLSISPAPAVCLDELRVVIDRAGRCGHIRVVLDLAILVRLVQRAAQKLELVACGHYTL